MDLAVQHGFSSGVSASRAPNIKARRTENNNKPSKDPESVASEPPMNPQEVQLRRIAPYIFRLDLWAAQTVTEDFNRDERLKNVKPHFEHLWGVPPPIDQLEGWLNNRSLYDPQDIMNLPGFRDYLERLSLAELLNAIDSREACAFYVRLMQGRMFKLQEKNTIYRLAEQDLQGSFEINLGLLIEERAKSPTEYLASVAEKQLMAQVRLAGTLKEARLLRDQINRAYRLRALDDELLELLRPRVLALEQHYTDAWKLLGDEQQDRLLDAEREPWLVPSLQRARSLPVSIPAVRTATSHLALIGFLFSLFASYPAWMCYLTTPAGYGYWADANFYALVSGSLLQTLGLGTQIMGPVLFPGMFQLRVGRGVKIWIWILSSFTFLCVTLSVLLYGLVSAPWSGLVAFAGQATMGLSQLLLVFGA